MSVLFAISSTSIADVLTLPSAPPVALYNNPSSISFSNCAEVLLFVDTPAPFAAYKLPFAATVTAPLIP